MMQKIATFSPFMDEIAVPNTDAQSPIVAPKASVLVCEDESMIRFYLVDLLEELGFSVLEAANGRDAMEQMSTCGADFLITDLGLPDMPGKELAQRLRNRWPLLPVLFATGRGREDVDLSDGYTAYLAKPFTMQTLQSALSGLIASSALSAT